MAKIAVSIPDSTLKKIDEQSNTKGITRSKYVAIALDFYTEGASNYKNDIDKLNADLTAKTQELESISIEVLPLREKIHTLENQIAENDKKIKSLSKEVLLQKDEGMKIREELEKAKHEAIKYEMAFKSQQADLDFLRGHVVFERDYPPVLHQRSCKPLD